MIQEIMLILHFLGLAMGIGTSFAFMFLGIAASKMDKEEAHKFTLNTFTIAKMGHIGLTLSIITGLHLMTPYWRALPDMPLLLTKLILVVVLGAIIGILSATAKKAQKGDTEKHLKKIETLGKLSMLTGLAILTLAVFSFH